MTTIADTVPYPWPYDGCIDADRLALLICGAQQGFAAICERSSEVLDSLAELAERCRSIGVTVVFVRHGTEATVRSGALPVIDTPSWQLALDPAPGDLVVDAAGWDGSFGSPLDHLLRRHGRDHLVLCGLATELTVDSTVRTLNDRGHECLVLVDGCAPVDAILGARAHASLTMSGGIFGALGTIDALAMQLFAVSNYSPDIPKTVEAP